MKSPNIRKYADVLTGELLSRGEWVTANIEGSIPWPVAPQKIDFRGQTLWIIPVTTDHYHGVAVKLGPSLSDRTEAERLLLRFLSALSWVEGGGVTCRYLSGGDLPRMVGRELRHPILRSEPFYLPYLPEPSDPAALRALALFREGRGLDHAAYKFLSFFKILNVSFNTGREMKAWINNNAGKVRDFEAAQVIERLRAAQGDVGVYLYESGRCAVAHAYESPTVDPDDPSDMRRLSSELPAMVGLSELAIEQELGIKTAGTIYREHLYELVGFKEIFGPDVVTGICDGTLATDGVEVSIPHLRLELWDGPQYPAFARLIPKSVGFQATLVQLLLESQSARMRIRLTLDFSQERIFFDPDEDIACGDDNTADGAQEVLDALRFCRTFWANGILRIFDADTGALLSRKDAFIPSNVWLTGILNRFDDEISRWQAVLSERTTSPASPEAMPESENVNS
jgi:hypothetical protein